MSMEFDFMRLAAPTGALWLGENSTLNITLTDGVIGNNGSNAAPYTFGEFHNAFIKADKENARKELVVDGGTPIYTANSNVMSSSMQICVFQLGSNASGDFYNGGNNDDLYLSKFVLRKDDEVVQFLVPINMNGVPTMIDLITMTEPSKVGTFLFE